MCAWGVSDRRATVAVPCLALSGPAAAVAVPCFCPLRPCGPPPPHAWEAGLIGYVQTLSVTERASLAAFYFLRDPLANIIKVRVYLCICKAQNF